jgi:outer membrane protein assembly factor BamE (lipoprotein component of BamABCDE complex)
MANVLCKRVAVGMTATQVRLAWGTPQSINTTTYASGDHDQWVYGNNYVYLENGIVTAMQTSH